MAKIKIPDQFLEKLGPPMAMDEHKIDVKLKDGRVFRKLVVRNSMYITGRSETPTGISNLNFSANDIKNLRRSPLLSIWPFW